MTLHTQGLHTLAQVRAFVSGNEPISFTLTDRYATYGWMAATLRQFGYVRGKRADKGILRQYLLKVTGFSRAQIARCITQFTDGGHITDRPRASHAVCAALYGRGHPAVGTGGCPAWHPLRLHHT